MAISGRMMIIGRSLNLSKLRKSAFIAWLSRLTETSLQLAVQADHVRHLALAACQVRFGPWQQRDRQGGLIQHRQRRPIKARAIFSWERPASNFSRKHSLILRMATRCAAIPLLPISGEGGACVSPC